MGYNSYIYAPKDDLYHRSRWREVYPGKRFNELVETIEVCKGCGLDFVFTLSPGGDITYSNNLDIDKVIEKFLTFYKLGVKSFGLFFDDIAFELPEGDDKKEFGTIDRAQNYFYKEVYKRLKVIDDSLVFSVCPTLYHGSGKEDYIKGFARDMPEDIHLFWTGREVCSQVLSGPDAVKFSGHTGHRPTYWDNYPVNDSIMKWELHLGPYDKRDEEIVDSSNGIVLNPMEYGYSSLIPLYTVADFFRDPDNYDRDKSWLKAIEKYIDRDIREAYTHFASFCYKSCIYPYFSNKKLMARLMENMNKKDWDCGSFLKVEGEKGLIYADTLLGVKDNPFIQEARPWIENYKVLMEVFTLYSQKESKKDRWDSLLESYILNRYEIFQLEVFNEIDNK